MEVCLIPTCKAENHGLDDLAPCHPPIPTITLPWTAPSFAAVKGIVHAPYTEPAMKPESRDALLAAITKARGWIDDIRVGAIGSFAEIAEREAQGERHIRLLAPLAFLSPRIIAAIVDGTAPADLTVTGLAKALPYSWAEQEERVGLSLQHRRLMPASSVAEGKSLEANTQPKRRPSGSRCAVFTAIIAFAVLPGLETFEAFSLAIGLYLIPVGALVAQPRQTVIFTAMIVGFGPLLAPANEMSYDPQQFYNSALAIFAGSGAAALSFRLLRPLSPAFRARRLLALTLRDLRRLATGPIPRAPGDWEGRMYGRLAVCPDVAEPLQRSQFLAALAVGSEIIQLRHIATRTRSGLGPRLGARGGGARKQRDRDHTACPAR